MGTIVDWRHLASARHCPSPSTMGSAMGTVPPTTPAPTLLMRASVALLSSPASTARSIIVTTPSPPWVQPTLPLTTFPLTFPHIHQPQRLSHSTLPTPRQAARQQSVQRPLVRRQRVEGVRRTCRSTQVQVMLDEKTDYGLLSWSNLCLNGDVVVLVRSGMSFIF